MQETSNLISRKNFGTLKAYIDITMWSLVVTSPWHSAWPIDSFPICETNGASNIFNSYECMYNELKHVAGPLKLGS